MQTVRRAALFVVSLLLLAACTQGVEVGELQVTVTGVPVGAPVSIVVTGPAGFNSVITQSSVLTSLRAGAYTLTPGAVLAPNTGYDGVETFTAAAEAVTVPAAGSTPVTIAYAYQGLTVDDPQGDAAGNANNYPIFDAVSLSSQVSVGSVTFTVTLSDAATNLTTFAGVIDLDIDQDVTTGVPAIGLGTCPSAGDFGSELRLFMDLEFVTIVDLSDDSELDLEPPVVAGTSVTVTVPKALLLGDDGRVSAVAYIGNFDEPTDCLP